MKIPFVLLLVAAASTPLMGAQSDEFVGFRTSTAELTATRNFYSAPLTWYFQPGGLGSISMVGYGRTANGGTIRQASVCFYNESAFSRNFQADVSIKQGNTVIQTVRFARSFSSQRHSCHTLSGFNAQVVPGEFRVQAAFSQSVAENFWAGFSATDSGDVFDVEISGARPPYATGAQGPVRMNGVGLGYRIEENDPPPAGCAQDDNTICLVGGRFKVEAVYDTGKQIGLARLVRLTDETGYFWFFSAGNIEGLVKVLDGCALNRHFWVFTTGMTNVSVEITVTDTLTGQVRSYTNPLNTPFVAVQDTAALEGCL